MRLRLIHWSVAEAEERAGRLRALGHEVVAGPAGPAVLREIAASPPDAIVISLDRLPSHGRAVASALRGRASTRRVPLVFLGGAPEKVVRVRERLPDAVFSPWRGARGAIARAVARPPRDPWVPPAPPPGAKPAARKLGIRSGTTVALVGAPERFAGTLEGLPEDVTIRPDARGSADLTLWFVRSRRDLARRIARMAGRAEAGGLWILWPKRMSGVPTDLTQEDVRRAGLGAGLVDYKVCAVDATWSAFRFARRRRR